MGTTYVAGKYLAEVIDQGFTVSAAKGTPGFYLQFKILSSYDDHGKIQACPQYERTYAQWLANEMGVNILKGDLKALGVEITDLVQLDRSSPGHISLIGRKIDVTCEIETYQGKQRERWGISRAITKLDLTSVSALSERFGHLLRKDGSRPKPDAVAPKPNGSDIPF